MGVMQRTKGKAGEREIAAIISEHTGWNVKRRVRQSDGDSDLEGVPGWSIEVKRHRSATRSDVAGWWRQSVQQSGDLLPVLFYRLDRDSWRSVWPASVFISEEVWTDYALTVEGSVEAWSAVAREANARLRLARTKEIT